MENTQSDQQLAALKLRWESVRELRLEIAAELNRMATSMPRETRKYLQSIGHWFQGDANFEDAIERPDVLAICVPLLVPNCKEPISRAEIVQAVRTGFCSAGRNVSLGRRLFRVMLYPILIILAASLLAIGFSFWIAPEFEEMFEDFGIELPALTLLVLRMSQLVRHWWWIVVSLPIAAALLFSILNRTGGTGRPANLSWLDQRLMSTRNALAGWAWHISLLLRAGLPQIDAIRAAGSATGNSWLRQLSFSFTTNPSSDETDTNLLFSNPKYQLLDRAIQMPESPGKIALLRQVAIYYWDRSSSIGDWWIHWLVAFFIILVGAAIALCVIALFLPLIAIVSGLTGGKM